MRFFTLFLMSLLIFPVQATTKVDVFSAEVLLDTEADEVDAEKLARAEGLKQVVIRASGDKQAAENEVIVKALSKSANYLSQMGFSEQDGSPTLKMVFNPPQIQSLLNQAQLPYWSEERANLLVWVVEENRYGREILWEHSASDFINQFGYFSALRGLPITIPVGDFDDVTNISATDLWGGFLEPVSVVSQRYPADAVLVIITQTQGSRTSIRWTLYDTVPEQLAVSKLQPVSGMESGSLTEALESTVDNIANYYAQKSSVKKFGESSESVIVDFVGIDYAKSFYELESYLKQLQSVASVDVIKIVGDKVTFEVHLLASDIEFESEVIQNPKLRKVEREFMEEAPELTVTESENAVLGPDTADDSLPLTDAEENSQPATEVTEEVTEEVAPEDLMVDDDSIVTEENETSETDVTLMFEWFD